MLSLLPILASLVIGCLILSKETTTDCTSLRAWLSELLVNNQFLCPTKAIIVYWSAFGLVYIISLNLIHNSRRTRRTRTRILFSLALLSSPPSTALPVDRYYYSWRHRPSTARSRNISYRHWWSAVRRCRSQSTPVPAVSAAYRPPIIARVGRRVLRSHWSAATTIALPERGNVALAVSSRRRVSVSVR